MHERQRSWAAEATAALVASIVVVAFVRLAGNGYGDNPDNYGLLKTWQYLVSEGRYVSSRFQGNLPSELAVGWLAQRFGPWGPNLFSFAAALAGLAALWALLRPLTADRGLAVLAVAAVAINPWWQNAASTAMDYLHPVPFFLAGLLLLRRDRLTGAALAFAVAGAIRVGYAPLALVLLIAIPLAQGRRARDLIEPVLVLLVVTGLFYVPVWISAGLTTDFLASARPTQQGLAGLLARFVVKGANLYGLAGTLVVLAILALRGRALLALLRRQPWTGARAGAAVVALAVIGYHLLLFLYIPVRPEYLMPVLPAVAALCVVFDVPRAALVALIAAQLSFWFVRFEPLAVAHLSNDPCADIIATNARVAPHLETGILLDRLRGRTNEHCHQRFLKYRLTDVHAPLPVGPPR